MTPAVLLKRRTEKLLPPTTSLTGAKNKMFRGTQILCSLALFSCITQHSGSSLAPNETDDTSAAQLPGVPNASPLQIPNPSPVLHSNNSTKASDSWAGLRPPVAITPLNPDAVAKQIAVDRVNIPERPVHVQGAGAYGTFTVTTNFAQSHTMMDLFSNVGQTTPVTVRFSNALGENGWLDTARNVRGFAMKFHTKQGLWDLLSRHPAKFPAFVEAQGRDPVTNLRDADRAFGFFANNPESMNVFLRLFSSAGISRGQHHFHCSLYCPLFRFILTSPSFFARLIILNRMGSYELVECTWSYVKLTFETQQGVLNFTEAEQAQVKDPGYAARELYSSIESGKFPRWKLYAQVMSAKEAENFKYNVLDSTKDWPTSLVAQQEIGVLELNKNPTDYHTEASQTSIIAVKSEIDEDPKTQEKQAFTPANFVPGWAASHDPILQMRMAIYADSSRYRLHQNSDPVKIAKRDLLNTQMPNGNGPPQILKNSAQVLSNPSPKQIPGGPITDAAPKYDYEHSLWINNALKSMDVISPIDFEQPAMFYGNLTQSEKLELIHNIAGGLSLISSSDIRTNFINWLAKASADLSEQVAKKLKSMTA
ncbi:hypothetical protein PSHT_01943 [Puccinia striiformis]|uniref:Catalase core domain-containing protein n=1 Tax=Puccinia striiformis TaxID=27350 RepID=A0A2S4WJB6_9BASI|nr:hypothetical protein PSHT_01943 [Puccinia striiformis]